MSGYDRDKAREYRRRSRAKDPLRNIWASMKQRCNNPNSTRYEFYGARGIKVCPRWNESYYAFAEDMGPRPSLKHSLDRIDNDGDYCAANCKWSCQSEQVANRRPYSNTGEKYIYYIETQVKRYKVYKPPEIKTKSFVCLEDAIKHRDSFTS